jgi:nucleoside-diphosphate-sugar epimerase
VRVVVTGATGFLGSRIGAHLETAGHDVVRLARPGGAIRADAPEAIRVDVGDPVAKKHLAGADAVLHFAGVPDPARAQADPARAVRENVGSTLNLLEGCLELGAVLFYPSTVRVANGRATDAYALSKRLGEEACRLHRARATVVRLTSVFGPGQVAWEGATGAIATFAARALEQQPIVINGDPDRTRDFVYVDDVASVVERLLDEARWNETLTLASGVATSLSRAAELVRAAAGVDVPIETPGTEVEPEENASYTAKDEAGRLTFSVRPLEEAIGAYVHWLESHPAAQGRSAH